MTSATSGSAADDDVVTMELVEDEEPQPARRELLSPQHARIAFLSLAGVAGAALVAAILIIALAPDSAVVWLVVALVVLVVVVVAEIVLLVFSRPQKAA